MKIDGVVVLYNSDESVVENIKSYKDYLNVLYIIDNSEITNDELISEILERFSNIKYIKFGKNKGIAFALNTAAELAIKNGADWLLTMDQDSSFNQNNLEKMINFIKTNNIKNLGIVSPMHCINENNNKFSNLVTMTSGNLLNLKIYKNIGGFLEKLFIDGVDTEYCLRLNKLGYKLIRIEDVILDHNLGNVKKYKFFRFEFYSTNHNFIRRYYMIRNRFFIWKLYKDDFPEFIKFEKKVTIKEIIKIILVEKDKFRKIKYMIKGYMDYKRNKFGKLEL